MASHAQRTLLAKLRLNDPENINALARTDGSDRVTFTI